MTKGTPHIQPNGVKIAKTVLMPGDATCKIYCW